MNSSNLTKCHTTCKYEIWDLNLDWSAWLLSSSKPITEWGLYDGLYQTEPMHWSRVVFCPSELMASDDSLSSKSEVQTIRKNGNKETATGRQPREPFTEKEWWSSSWEPYGRKCYSVYASPTNNPETLFLHNDSLFSLYTWAYDGYSILDFSTGSLSQQAPNWINHLLHKICSLFVVSLLLAFWYHIYQFI